ncbi:hypothetical protein [Streptomyces sp. RG80]|uniref:hypothetical protein n=1 Tax=Streptomyces sp. RG80 TaxID=3157340 RepID=UPI00339018E3
MDPRLAGPCLLPDLDVEGDKLTQKIPLSRSAASGLTAGRRPPNPSAAPRHRLRARGTRVSGTPPGVIDAPRASVFDADACG